MTDGPEMLTGAKAAEDELAGLEAWTHSVVRKHGRAMYATVVNAGMGQEAVQTLSTILARHPQGKQALVGLATGLNEVMGAYVRLQGWTPAQLAQCDKDLQEAFALRVIVPGGGRIVLAH